MKRILCAAALGLLISLPLNAQLAGESAPAFSPPAGFFPILPWCQAAAQESPELDKQAGLGSIADCDFNLSGFVKAKDLPVCERLGLMAIVDADKRLDFRNRKAAMSDEQIDAWVKEMVDASAGSKAVLGYYIVDEPGTSSFPRLARAVAAVKKYAPGKLAYINLFPGYATLGARDMSQLEAPSFRDYLEQYVREVKPQVLSYDNYMVEFSMDLKNEAKTAAYWRDLLEVRSVALEHGLPFWNIVTCNQIRPFTTPPSPANLLFQAYTTLAAGGKGVSWFHYFGRGYGYPPIDKENHRTVSWSYLQMVNRQLKVVGPMMLPLKSSGAFFTQPPVKAAVGLPGKLVESAQADAPLMLGEFSGPDGAAWVMLVNLSLERSTRVTLKLAGGRKGFQAISPADGSLWTPDTSHGLWLTAGQGMLLKME